MKQSVERLLIRNLPNEVGQSSIRASGLEVTKCDE